jgi:hypothetical protein
MNSSIEMLLTAVRELNASRRELDIAEAELKLVDTPEATKAMFTAEHRRDVAEQNLLRAGYACTELGGDPHGQWMSEWRSPPAGESEKERGHRIDRLSEQMLKTPRQHVAAERWRKFVKEGALNTTRSALACALSRPVRTSTFKSVIKPLALP